jgi:hypothetical protein
MWWVDASVLAVLVTQLSGPELAHVGVLIDEDAEGVVAGPEGGLRGFVSVDLLERAPATEINSLAGPASLPAPAGRRTLRGGPES